MPSHFEKLEESVGMLAEIGESLADERKVEALQVLATTTQAQAALAICECLGGGGDMVGALRDIDAQINVLGGGLAETLGRLAEEMAGISRTLDRIEGKLV